MIATARAVKAAGATALRGGAFKPRTSPYSFQGLKEEGLKMLAAAREETGLAVVTEVMATEDVPLVAHYADVLQIGARNMQNYRLLEAVGEAGKPVLLKRGPAPRWTSCCWPPSTSSTPATRNVMLCERGIRTFETHTRFTLPLASVPYLHEQTHLPVVVDPSHGTGHSEPGAADGGGRDCGRRRRPDRGSASRSGERPERRLRVAESCPVRGVDAALQPRGGSGRPRDQAQRALRLLPAVASRPLSLRERAG